MYFFLFNRTTLQVFITYLTGALYVHPLWFYKHQHDNRVRSKLFVACQRWRFQLVVLIRAFSSGIHTHPVSWNCAHHLRMEFSDCGCFLNLVRNCRRTTVPRQSFWITLYNHWPVNSVFTLKHRVFFLSDIKAFTRTRSQSCPVTNSKNENYLIKTTLWYLSNFLHSNRSNPTIMSITTTKL